jgi:excisionase family DNA binding protein
MSTTFHSSSSTRQPFLKVNDVARLLNVKPRTIYEMVAQNRIPYRKPPGTNILRFDLDEILAWTRGENNK